MFIPLIKIVEFIIFTNKLYIFNKNLSRKKEKATPKCRMEKFGSFILILLYILPELLQFH